MSGKSYIDRLTEWMEEHKQMLFRYACYRVGDEADAEDILQDVYLRMIEKGDGGVLVGNLQAYVFRTLVNACSSHLRQFRHQPLDNDDLPDMSCDPENFGEEAGRITALLELMPEQSREVMRLKIYASMTFDAVAEVLQISPTTAKRRYYEGLEYLRLRLYRQ